jgi:hypothetical protein
MTLEELYYFSQIVAVIAIFGSLVILIVQMRAANQLAREAANNTQIAGLQEISKSVFEIPGLADIWERGTRDLAALESEERVRFVAYTSYTLRIWEGLHLQRLRGRITDDLWTSHTRLFASVQNLPGFNEAWEIRRATFSTAFGKFYDQNKTAWTVGEPYGRQSPGQKTLMQPVEPRP